MNQELMTLDFWQDTVIYEGKIFPIGTLACDALNVPADAALLYSAVFFNLSISHENNAGIQGESFFRVICHIQDGYTEFFVDA